MRLIAVLALMLPAAAQFRDLATDRAADRILFSSNLTLEGEQRNNESKLLEADRNGRLRTFLSVPSQWLPGDRAPLNFPSLRWPSLSADGAVVAWTGTRTCSGGSGCLGVELWMGNVSHGRCAQGERCQTASAGRAKISAGGRWAAFINPVSLGRQYGMRQVDLASGAATDWRFYASGVSAAGRRSVAEDGTFVAGDSEPALMVHKPGSEPVKVRTTWNLTEVVVSDDGRFAVGQTMHSAPRLVAVELGIGWETTLVEAEEGCTQPVLTGDGLTMLFLSGANWEAKNDGLAVQVWTMELNAGRLRQWTFEPDGIREATISGDGSTVVAATIDGRLLRVDGLTLVPTEIAHVAEVSTWIPGQVARGSRYELFGAGLGWAELSWKGRPVAPVSRSPERLEFIFPWDAEPGNGELVVSAKDSPFQPQRFTADLGEVAPRFISKDYRVVGTRSDGTELSDANPARPSEVITIRMVGLGPVDSAGRVVATLDLAEGTAIPGPIEILSARSDPDREGYYLVTARVPNRTYSVSLVTWLIRMAGAEHYNDTGIIPVAIN